MLPQQKIKTLRQKDGDAMCKGEEMCFEAHLAEEAWLEAVDLGIDEFNKVSSQVNVNYGEKIPDKVQDVYESLRMKVDTAFSKLHSPLEECVRRLLKHRFPKNCAVDEKEVAVLLMFAMPKAVLEAVSLGSSEHEHDEPILDGALILLERLKNKETSMIDVR